MSVTLILGGGRSGKSRRAEALAEETECLVCYVATAQAIEGDAEWQQRIDKHKEQRPNHWKTIEEPLHLDGILNAAKQGQTIVIDCLTLWLFNVMMESRDVEKETCDLCVILETCQADVICVSNELGMGLVPESKLGRDFRDAQGRLNQAVAKVADCVEFIVAGVVMPIKMKERLHAKHSVENEE